MADLKEAIKKQAVGQMSESRINITLEDSLKEFFYSREDYISAKVEASEEYKIAWALYEKNYLALQELVKGITGVSELLFELDDQRLAFEMIETEMFYNQGLNDGLGLINSIKAL